ncbi:PqqD family protein [Streptomyces sp. NPDC047108]|uniref:PqqD family protein n=1 Tax=Streptomyces sp. NPDC047108 TaxID=3155025 RepID=UPI00340E2EAA
MSHSIDPEVTWISSGDEVRVYDHRAGEFRTLNSTGAQIWLLLADNRSVDAIVTELAGRFTDGSPAQNAMVARDVGEFVTELVAQGLVVTTEDGLAGTHAARD